MSKTDDELLTMAKNWTVVGKDLVSGVSCTEPYEWTDKTEKEWEFGGRIPDGDFEPFKVVAYDYGCKVPVFGICMGHQLLGQALGGATFKMKFGHHGRNHPVRHLPTGRIDISAQNHNYAVDPASLPEGVEGTHINLNDGLSFPALKVMSIQYHPELRLAHMMQTRVFLSTNPSQSLLSTNRYFTKVPI